MFTGKMIFLAVSAVAILYLSWRLFRRNRAERLAARKSGASLHTSETSAVSGATVLAGKPGSPPPLPANAHALANGERYLPSPESRSYTNPNWTGRSLFQVDDAAAQDQNDLPMVRPDEVPINDTSRCTFGAATPILASLLPESPDRREVIKKELQSAGYYQPYAWHNLASLRYVLLMGSILLFGALLLFVPPAMETPVIVAMISCAIIGWSVPRLMVRSQGAARLSEIERAMPDMLDMLNMSVSQGMTVHESLGRIATQIKPVSPALSEELKIVNEQASVGSLEQALLNFGNRIDLPEVHSFTTLIIQTERMGTSVSDALQQYSDNMRESLRQRADEKANAASFRLLFPTVIFLMPAVFIFLLGPAIIELSDFFTGQGRQVLTRSRGVVDDVNLRLPDQFQEP